MDKATILQNLADAIVQGDEDLASENARLAMENHMDPLEAVDQGLSKGMDEVGQQFERGDVYLPELLMAANAFNAAMKFIKPELEAQKKRNSPAGHGVDRHSQRRSTQHRQEHRRHRTGDQRL